MAGSKPQTDTPVDRAVWHQSQASAKFLTFGEWGLVVLLALIAGFTCFVGAAFSLLVMRVDPQDISAALPLVFLGVAGLTALLALAMIAAKHADRSRHELRNYGFPLRCQTISLDSKHIETERSAVRFIARGIHPRTKQECLFESDDITGLRPNTVVMPQSVFVYLDPNDDERYYVDLTTLELKARANDSTQAESQVRFA